MLCFNVSNPGTYLKISVFERLAWADIIHSFHPTVMHVRLFEEEETTALSPSCSHRACSHSSLLVAAAQETARLYFLLPSPQRELTARPPKGHFLPRRRMIPLSSCTEPPHPAPSPPPSRRLHYRLAAQARTFGDTCQASDCLLLFLLLHHLLRPPAADGVA